MSEVSRSFATAQVQAGYVPGVAENTAVPPIYQSNAFEFSSLSQARDLFALRREGNIYSRAANPTVLVFEQRVAELEGGIAAAAVASGQAAVALALLALAKQGEHIVAARQLYGGTIDLLQDTFADWGIDVTFVDQDDADAWTAAVRPTTRALFAESITNPNAQVLDIRAVARVAHDAGVPLVIDHTVATPYLQRVKDFGADIVVHSATKYLGGHGTSLGGVIVDLGTFDFTRGARPLAAAHRAVPPRAGRQPRRPIRRDRVAVHRARQDEVRARPRPFAAGVQRVPAAAGPRDARPADRAPQRERTRGRDASSKSTPRVARVNHPGLASSPWHDARARVPAARRGSGLLVRRGSPRATPSRTSPASRRSSPASRSCVSSRTSAMRAASIAHPASMTHSHMSPAQLAEAGITSTTIRLSIGLEDPADVIADLDRALTALAEDAAAVEPDQSCRRCSDRRRWYPPGGAPPASRIDTLEV